MRLTYTVIILLISFVGCGGPDPVAVGRQHAADQIERVKSGSARSLHVPPLDLFADAAKDIRFVDNLRELSLCGDFARYSNVSLESLVHLERVTLVDTKNTVSYLKALPPNIKILSLDCTDLTSGPGHSQRLKDRALTESWLQEMTTFDSLEKLFFCPWQKRVTPIAAEVLPKLQSLKKLDLEWASEEDAATLRRALPNCNVRVVTEH